MGKKLVRDRIAGRPWIVEAAKEGLRLTTGAPEYNMLLRQKLLEEVSEFLTAETGADAVDEAADIIEVVLTIVNLWDQPIEAVEIRRAEKLAERGGFSRGLVLEL